MNITSLMHQITLVFKNRDDEKNITIKIKRLITTNFDIIYIYLLFLTFKILDRKMLNICFKYYDLLVRFCCYLFLITIFSKIITTVLVTKLLY